MYTIKVPQIAVDVAAYGHEQFGGTHVSTPVIVDWPELRLTVDQITANVVARLNGDPEPFPDRSFIAIELPFAKVPA